MIKSRSDGSPGRAKFQVQLQSGKNKENMAARDFNTNEESLEPRVRSPDRKRYKMYVNLGKQRKPN